jgi:regulatory protein
MTERRLENIALFYLQRFSASAAHLRRVLLRRIDKSLGSGTGHAARRAEMAAWVDALIARLVAGGSLNDRLYAEGLVQKLRRLGKSPAKIRARLLAKGLAAPVIDEIMDAEDGASDDEAVFQAALNYARRRRIGPHRETAVDQDTRRKDLGALARAGFSKDVASRVMAIPPGGDRDD